MSDDLVGRLRGYAQKLQDGEWVEEPGLGADVNEAASEVERLRAKCDAIDREAAADSLLRKQAEARLREVVEALIAVWTFPGVRDLFAPEESLGSVAGQVRAALAAAQPEEGK